jgi:hypothetical protein
MPKLLGKRQKNNADRRPVDARVRRTPDEIAHEVAKQEAHRLAILRDYGRTLGY